MKNGIIYYNTGTKCLIRLCTSIHALRWVYDGPVTVLYDNIPEWTLKFLAKYDIQYKEITDPKSGSGLVRKSQLWKYSPYDKTVFIDADTIPVKSPEPLFQVLKKTPFFTTEFCGWKTNGRMIRGRIQEWECIIGKREVQKALNYGSAVNTGVFGFCKDASILPEWERLAIEGDSKNCTRRIVDEIACQVLLHNHPHQLLSTEWNRSCKHDKTSEPKIIHYHGSKHVHPYLPCDIWKQMYLQMTKHNPEFEKDLTQSHGDKRFKRWYKYRTEDLTVVTAVNDKYFNKFKENWPKWNAMPFFQNRRVVVFYNNLNRQDVENIVNKHRCVDLIEWNHPQSGDNIRERMLSAFVFGVDRHVDSEYWMKLDCDVSPKMSDFPLPDYRKYVCLGHKWHYTKVKGDPNATEHWLNTLDNWWINLFPDSKALFESIDYPNVRSHSHKRFCSFVYFEKLKHTQLIAYLCDTTKTPNKLPVPSQDTTSWYVAQQEYPDKIGYTKFKKWWSPN